MQSQFASLRSGRTPSDTCREIARTGNHGHQDCPQPSVQDHPVAAPVVPSEGVEETDEEACTSSCFVLLLRRGPTGSAWNGYHFAHMIKHRSRLTKVVCNLPII